MTPGGTRLPGSHPPSHSMIPAPIFQILSPFLPRHYTLSNYRDHDHDGRESLTLSHASFRTSAMHVQTPEATLRRCAQAVPFYGQHQVGVDDEEQSSTA